MGNIIRRGWKNFNVESRAHRYIEKQASRRTAQPLPRHPNTERLLQKVQQEHPDAMEEHILKKNVALHDRLKEVMVDSTEVQGKRLDSEIDKDIPRASNRSLPQLRTAAGSPIIFPDEIPIGRISVPKAMELLAKHRQDKEKWTCARLSEDYKLDPKDTANILEYFQTFKIIPLNPNDPNPKLPIDEKRQLSAD